MTDLETLMRETLTDDRRQLTVPRDPVRWVHGAVRRQRRRNAMVGLAATTVVALAAVVVAVPMLTDVEAAYVVGRPNAESGLLPWRPVGTLVEEPDVVTSAVEAWERLADDEPAGDVHLVAGERWDDTEMVVLQADTDSGAASIAVLTTDDGAAGSWALRDTSRLPDGDEVQALVLPAQTIPGESLPRGLGPGSPASLVLGQAWRVSPQRSFSSSVGSQLVPDSLGFGQGPEWQPVDRVEGYGWWAPLTMSAPDGLPPTTVVLDHTGRRYADVAPVLSLDASAGLSALSPSDVSLRLLPREAASVEWLDDIRAVAELLDIGGPSEATVLQTVIGSFSMGPRPAPIHQKQTRTLFAQFSAPELASPVLVAYATTGDAVTCFSQRPVPAADVFDLPFVGMGCPSPVAHGTQEGAQGHEMWAGSSLTDPGLMTKGLDIDVTLVRRGGQTTTHNLGELGLALGVLEDATEPVRRYVFTVRGTLQDSELPRWIWPASPTDGLLGR